MASFAVALPYLIVKAVYLLNLDRLDDIDAPFLILTATIPVALFWLTMCAAEHRWRARRYVDARRRPWLAIVGGVALLLFLVADDLARPLALSNPEWARVYQIVRWGQPESGDGYVLVVAGLGNRANHRFESGYLNWAGDEPAGSASISLQPPTLHWWEENAEQSVPAELDVLRTRVANTGYSPEAVEALASDIWSVLTQATAGQPLSSANARVDAISIDPREKEDVLLGAGIWSAALVLALQLVGQVSLPIVAPSEPTEGGN